MEQNPDNKLEKEQNEEEEKAIEENKEEIQREPNYQEKEIKNIEELSQVRKNICIIYVIL